MSNFLSIKTSFCLVLLLLLTACSSPQPANQWQHDAVSMSHNYQIHSLQNKLTRARLDLNHARERASSSSDLKTLIDIELSVCAIETGSLSPYLCDDTARLLQLQPNPVQEAYLKLLTSTITQEEIFLLPDQYQDFAEVYIAGDTAEINKILPQIRPLTSRLIASALAKESIDDTNIQGLIDELSYHGYKRPLLAWLNIQLQREDDLDNKEQLKAKIDILTSN